MRRCSCQNAGCATRKISRRAVTRGGEIPRFFILNYCLHFGAGRSLTLKPNAKKPIGRTKVNCWGWGWGTGWRARFAPRSVASQSPRTRARVCPPHLLRLSPPFRHCARRFAPRTPFVQPAPPSGGVGMLHAVTFCAKPFGSEIRKFSTRFSALNFSVKNANKSTRIAKFNEKKFELFSKNT